MALDHGLLNLPGRTDKINRDLDHYKADRAAEQRAAVKKQRDLRVLAKAAVAALTSERVELLARQLGVTPTQVRKDLGRTAHWTPALCLKALASDARKG